MFDTAEAKQILSYQPKSDTVTKILLLLAMLCQHVKSMLKLGGLGECPQKNFENYML